MTRQPDILYVRYYTGGAAAPNIEPQPHAPTARPGVRTRPVRVGRRKVIRVDLINVCAVVVAAVMLVAMVIGLAELGAVRARRQQLEDYTTQLQAENIRLQAEYEAGYDLEDIRQRALEMGLVPVDSVPHITVELPEEEVQEELSGWERFWAEFWEMFS